MRTFLWIIKWLIGLMFLVIMAPICIIIWFFCFIAVLLLGLQQFISERFEI